MMKSFLEFGKNQFFSPLSDFSLREIESKLHTNLSKMGVYQRHFVKAKEREEKKKVDSDIGSFSIKKMENIEANLGRIAELLEEKKASAVIRKIIEKNRRIQRHKKNIMDNNGMIDICVNCLVIYFNIYNRLRNKSNII